MRYLKRLLAAVYIYLAVFAAVCLLLWIVTRDEPSYLIAGVFGAAGVESVVGAIIKQSEIKSAEKIQKKEIEAAAETQQEDETAAESQQNDKAQ